MSREGEKMGIVPGLRFAEFEDQAAWRKMCIGKYLKESRIKGSKGDTAKKLTVKLWGNGVYAKQETLQGSENTQYFRRKAGQFIYSKLDFLNQAFGIIPNCLDSYESTVDLPCFDVSEKLNVRFLLEYVQRENFYKKYGEIADGGRKAKRIQVETFFEFPIILPLLPEQQKIADCLSSLDNLITAEDKKLVELKAHKKGLMQKLFPREGESVPEFRFAEFRDCGEWEETSFKQVFAKMQYGLNATGKKYDGKNKYIRITDIDESSRRYLNEKIVSPDCELDDNYLVRYGDILFARTGASTGKTYMYNTDDGILYFAGFLIRGNVNKKYYPQFIFAQTLSTKYEKWVSVTSIRSGQPGINANEYESFTFACPSMPEQQKISDCLSSLDNLITAQTQKIKTLKLHKKGLMQALFPKI